MQVGFLAHDLRRSISDCVDDGVLFGKRVERGQAQAARAGVGLDKAQGGDRQPVWRGKVVQKAALGAVGKDFIVNVEEISGWSVSTWKLIWYWMPWAQLRLRVCSWRMRQSSKLAAVAARAGRQPPSLRSGAARSCARR